MVNTKIRLIIFFLCRQRWRSSIQSAKTRSGAGCGSDHELLIAKFRLKLKKVGKTTSSLPGPLPAAQAQNIYIDISIGTYISIITLNVNGLYAPTKRHRLAKWIQKRPIYMLSTRNPLQTLRHMQTESERMDKYIPCKCEAKESWSSNPNIRQHRP